MSIRHRLGKLIPDQAKPHAAKFYYNIIRRPLHWGDRLGIIGPDQIYDDSYYEKRIREPWISEGREFSKQLDSVFDPDSVIDFGCGAGNHLLYFSESVDARIKGVEGNSKALQHALVDEIEIADLRQPHETVEQYDLVLSIEVAEHIPEKYVDNFLETLTRAGETVVITAAPPGQQGIHHVNCQPRDYWIDKFDEKGYSYQGEAVEQIRENLQLERTQWIEDNLFVFTQREGD